jgi:hypothetical protein
MRKIEMEILEAIRNKTNLSIGNTVVVVSDAGNIHLSCESRITRKRFSFRSLGSIRPLRVLGLISCLTSMIFNA